MRTVDSAHPSIQFRLACGMRRQPYEVSAARIAVRNIDTFSHTHREGFFDGVASPFHRIGLIQTRRCHFRQGRACHEQRTIVVRFELNAIGEPHCVLAVSRMKIHYKASVKSI
jgi:hypothetical protein